MDLKDDARLTSTSALIAISINLRQLVMQGQMGRPLTEDEMAQAGEDALKTIQGLHSAVIETFGLG